MIQEVNRKPVTNTSDFARAIRNSKDETLLLVNRKDLMGEYTNTVTFNVIAWVTAVAMIILTFVLVGQGVTQWVKGTPG